MIGHAKFSKQIQFVSLPVNNSIFSSFFFLSHVPFEDLMEILDHFWSNDAHDTTFSIL